MSWCSISADDAFKGKRAILACSGPSLDSVTADQWDAAAQSDEIIIAAVNNAPLSIPVRPQVWLTCDTPVRFPRKLWTTSMAYKFVLKNWRNHPLIKDRRDIAWYEVHNDFEPNKYLSDGFPTWGTQSRTDPMRHGIRSIMLVAIWTLYKMGVREINLVGCDFEMHRECKYANHTVLWSSPDGPNNNIYGRLNKTWFPKLMPHFDKHGLEIYNCTVGGKLEALPRRDLNDAL